jgi:FKBP-type peptidyl-prolyl cis-trans isomerase FklB
MKKTILSFLVLAVACSSIAQSGTGKPAVKPPVSKTSVKPAVPVMKNILDSASYAIGTSVANFYKSQGVVNINSVMVKKGLEDIMNGKSPAFDENTANKIMNDMMNMLQKNKVDKAIKAGEAFLAGNKNKPGIKTTPSGLQYEIIRDAQGDKPSVNDTFVCHYSGKLLNGTEFDNSFNRGQPLTYPVSRVIPGWTEGLQLMSIGSKYKFYIPQNLGYGLYGMEPGIPGGEMLIFEVELLDIKKFKTPDVPKDNH